MPLPRACRQELAACIRRSGGRFAFEGEKGDRRCVAAASGRRAYRARLKAAACWGKRGAWHRQGNNQMSTAAPLQTLAAAKPKSLSTSTHAGLLLQRKCACGSPTASLTGECAECKSKKRLQTKLTIGASNDPLEQEADRVADQVLAAPAHPAVSGAPPRIQRFTGQASAAGGYGARQRRPRPRQPWQAAGPGATTGHGAALRPRL